jgi:FkbM family methyltransferase
MTSGANRLTSLLLEEVLRDAHRYAPGLDQRRPTITSGSPDGWRRRRTRVRERYRDLAERMAARAGFVHRHFEPEIAAARLEALLAMSPALDRTYGLLADAPSRRALLDLLKLRILGPHHAPLRVTPQAYRARQGFCDRELCLEPGTFEVSDPWFSPLSLYRVPVSGGGAIRLHSHSVDVVSVFILEQYAYRRGTYDVSVRPGDTVIDIGGCWGDTALYFANLVGPEGRVYTFEFDPENLEVLRTNLELNPELAERIEVVEEALWDRAGEELGFAPAGRMTAIVDPARRPNHRVRTTTLDAFVERGGIDPPGFVKMDVEGTERRVLAGGRRTLSTFFPALAIAVYHREDDLVNIPADIEAMSLDYRMYLETFSPVEEETVLFATRVSSSK